MQLNLDPYILLIQQFPSSEAYDYGHRLVEGGACGLGSGKFLHYLWKLRYRILSIVIYSENV